MKRRGNSKYVLAIMICAYMGISMLAGCGKGKEELNATAQTKMSENTEIEDGEVSGVDTIETESAINYDDSVMIYTVAENESALLPDYVLFRYEDENGETIENAVDEYFLFDQLKNAGVVPASVSIVSANINEEDEERTILYLSVSGDYKGFINGLGNMEKEIVYLAALTNTYIENLAVDAVRLSVEGGNLVTENKVYNEPLTFYDPMAVDSVWEGYCYALEENSVMNEASTFAALYPQFTEMEDVAMMDRFNQQIKSFIDQKMNAHGEGTEIVHYEIAYQDGDFVSVIFRGECNSIDVANYRRYLATFNFDLKTGSNRRLKDYVDIGHVIDCLELSMGYELCGEAKITLEEFQEYVAMGGCEDFAFLLPDYDFDGNSPSFVPVGFTYLAEDEKPVIVMSIPAEMGSYVEIKLVD